MARLADLVPWFGAPPNEIHARAADRLLELYLLDADIGHAIARLPWLADGVTDVEQQAIAFFALVFTDTDTATFARTMAAFPWLPPGVGHAELQVLEVLSQLAAVDATTALQVAVFPWLMNGMDITELHVISSLTHIAKANTAIAQRIAAFPWLADGVTEADQWMIALLGHIARLDQALAHELVSLPWVVDGITEAEWGTMYALSLLAETDPELAQWVASLPWVVDGITEAERRMVSALPGRDLEFVQWVASLPWVVDGITEAEQWTVSWLAHLARIDFAFAQRLAGLSWVRDGIDDGEDQALARLAGIAKQDLLLALLLANSAWFVDGIDDDDRYRSEQTALSSLLKLSEKSSRLLSVVLGWAWITDTMTTRGAGALNDVSKIAEYDLDLALLLASSPWVSDGVVSHEASALGNLIEMIDWNPELARQLVGFSADAPVWNRDVYLFTSLMDLHSLETERFENLVSQPWFTDGLNPEESAFITALSGADDDPYDDLVDSYFTQSVTISLPLTGEVNLWAFQGEPFPPGEDLLLQVEQAVRSVERFMGMRFPTNDVIVLVVDDMKYLGGWAGTFDRELIRIARSGSGSVFEGTIYHEIGHYFTYGIGPFWFTEGVAEFIRAYTNDRFGLETLEDQLEISAQDVQSCVEHGIGNIHELVSDPWAPQALACEYAYGRYFLLSLHETLGEANLSAALRELYLVGAHTEPPPTEEAVYRAFLRHTPPELVDAFHDVYDRIHGGPRPD